MSAYLISGTYGSGKTPCIVFAYPTEGGTWYAVEGSLNVNCTTDPLIGVVDVETLEDCDCFTASEPITSTESLEQHVNS